MKKLLFLVALATFPAFAKADEVYSLTAQGTVTTGQLGILESDRDSYERRLCARYLLIKGSTCTQAALCTAANAAGGASCSNSQARAAGVRLYPSTLSGREEFLTFDWIAPVFQVRKASAQADAADAYCVWWRTQNQTVKNQECSKIGKPDNCEVCQ